MIKKRERIGRLAATAIVTVMAGGCVSSEHRAPVVAVPATFAPYASQGDVSSLDRWWLLFGDTQLDSLINEALAHAPDAQTALAVLDEARATRSQALTRFAPQGGIAASAGVQRVGVSGTPTATQGIFSGSFAPSWELGLFGRSAALRQTANADLDAALFAYHGTRQSLASNVAGNLFDARGSAVRLVQARETLRLAAELARIGERRVTVGIGSRADAASLRADEATAQANVRSIEAQLEISRRTLLTLLGRGADGLDTLPIAANFDVPPAVPAATPSTLLIRRPDIRQAEAQLRSAAGNLKLDALAFLPTVNLAPSFSIVPITGTGGYTSATASAGPGLTIPIFDRRRLFAQVRGQRARTEQAVIAFENTVQSGFAEAQNTLAQYAADRERLTSLEQAEERARYAFEAQRAGYRAGVVDLTALLQSERTWRANLLALSDLRTNALIDAVNVFRALGGGWPVAEAAAIAVPTSTVTTGQREIR